MPEQTIIAPQAATPRVIVEEFSSEPIALDTRVHVPAAPIAYTSSGVAVPVTKERSTHTVTLLPEVRMERTFQIPVVATIVFVITMIAIFYLGRTVSGYYEPVIVDGTVEFQGRS